MTAFAGVFPIGSIHLMVGGKIFEALVGFKAKNLRLGITERRNSPKVAFLACDPHVGVMGHLFIVWRMALQAIHSRLPVVAESGGVLVAGGACHFRMGSGGVGFVIH